MNWFHREEHRYVEYGSVALDDLLAGDVPPLA